MAFGYLLLQTIIVKICDISSILYFVVNWVSTGNTRNAYLLATAGEGVWKRGRGQPGTRDRIFFTECADNPPPPPPEKREGGEDKTKGKIKKINKGSSQAPGDKRGGGSGWQVISNQKKIKVKNKRRKVIAPWRFLITLIDLPKD